MTAKVNLLNAKHSLNKLNKCVNWFYHTVPKAQKKNHNSSGFLRSLDVLLRDPCAPILLRLREVHIALPELAET